MKTTTLSKILLVATLGAALSTADAFVASAGDRRIAHAGVGDSFLLRAAPGHTTISTFGPGHLPLFVFDSRGDVLCGRTTFDVSKSCSFDLAVMTDLTIKVPNFASDSYFYGLGVAHAPPEF